MKSFHEKQYLRQWWVWVLMAGVAGISIRNFFMMEVTSPVMFLPLVMVSAVVALLFFSNLDTTISEKGIEVKYFPFHLRPRLFAWDEIAKANVREYKPLIEYGGWGLRGLSPRNRAYNVSGNKGLQLEFTDGCRLLIGTKKPDEIKEVLKALNKGSGE